MAFLAAVLALAGTAAISMQRWSPYTQARIGGPFEMIDTSGTHVTEDDLRGRPTVLFFGYTSCPDVCPTTLSVLTSVMEKMGRDADRMNVVMVTVDPNRDTPAAMKLYLSSFDPRIRGFTGTEAQVAAMADTFHIVRKRVSRTDGSYEMAHTANALLLDSDTRLVGEIYYGETDASIFAKLTTLVPPQFCRKGGTGPADLWAQSATFGPGQSCGST